MRSLLGVNARMSSKKKTQQRSANRYRYPQAGAQPQRARGSDRYTVDPQSFGSVGVPKLGQPRIRMTKNGMEVTNDELAFRVSRTATTGTIPSGTDALNFQFANSPAPTPSPGSGNIGTNKWIGQLAVLFDKYVVKSLVYEFKPALPFTVAGQIGMYFDPDTQGVLPTSLDAITGNAFAQIDQVSQKQTLKVRKSQMNRLPQYVTSAGPTEYQVGRMGTLVFVNSEINLAAATSGGVSLGIVWVTYTVEFINPSNALAATPAALTKEQRKSLLESVVLSNRNVVDAAAEKEKLNLGVSALDRLNGTITSSVVNLVLAKLGHLEL